MANPVVPELDVLIATAVYLTERGAQLRHVSISPLSQAGAVADRERLKAELVKAGIPDNFVIYPNGEDLVAASPTELWYVECKGSPAKRDNPGVAAPFGTHRNQFDRALASVVSYYDHLQEDTKAGTIGYLGLALPITNHYLRELKRVRKRLRAQLNLWVLLYDSQGRTVLPIPPQDDYPSLE